MTALGSLPGLVEHDVPIGARTTYKFGGPARWYAEPGDTGSLAAVVAAAAADGVPVLVLGKGSNLVVSDHGYEGVVVRLAGRFLDIDFSDAGVEAGAAVTLPRLARTCARAGRGGLEWCVGIPGTVGGAVVMNAGGHGSDTAAWLVDATVVRAASGTEETIPAESLGLRYRGSALPDGAIVARARFRTVPRDPDQGEAMLREITAWRREHQPGGTLNAGSVFKNPPGDAAGRIIDALGLKGHRVGGAAVSDRHANFFVADDDASAQDLYDLVADVRRIVEERTGIQLEPEVRFAGEFDETSLARGGPS